MHRTEAAQVHPKPLCNAIARAVVGVMKNIAKLCAYEEDFLFTEDLLERCNINTPELLEGLNRSLEALDMYDRSGTDPAKR